MMLEHARLGVKSAKGKQKDAARDKADQADADMKEATRRADESAAAY